MSLLKLKGNCFCQKMGLRYYYRLVYNVFLMELFYLLSYDSMLFISIGITLCIRYLYLMTCCYLYLSATSYINCIAARCLINMVYLTACAFIRS